MNFNVVVTAPFERKLKRLAKKYNSIRYDLGVVIEELSQNPNLGIPLGNNCYKIRVAITSKKRGKTRKAIADC